MFWRNPRDGALLRRALENSKCFTQPRNHESKYAKAKLIKSLRLENKLQFGKLLESKKEKTKRVQLESKGLIPQAVPSSRDSELAWALAQSSRLTRIEPKKGAANSKAIPVIPKKEATSPKEIYVNPKKESVSLLSSVEINVNSDHDLQKEVYSETAAKNINNIKSKLTNEEVLNKKDNASAQEYLVSNDLLKNMIQYPIIKNDKSYIIQEVESSKILSVSSRADKSCLKYPSVTKILTATMTEEAKAVLEAWKLRMIQKLGARGFEVYQAELLGEGKILHSIIMDRLMQKDFSIPDRIKQAFSSLNKVIDTVNKVQALESHVVHSKLLYRGIVDCVAVYRDELCVIDWKKSDKTKSTISSTYDAPLQLAAYIGAINSDPNYPFELKKGLIVVAYMSGAPAEVHEINESTLQLYWELWLKRLQDYHSVNFS